MSNPRPCVCGHPESQHGPAFACFPEACFSCRPIVGCLHYHGVERTEPLRAKRAPACSGCGEQLHAEQIPIGSMGPIEQYVPGRSYCPNESDGRHLVISDIVRVESWPMALSSVEIEAKWLQVIPPKARQ